MITPAEREEIARIFAAVLEERRGIEADTHADHHRFIELLMQDRARRIELREAVKKQLIGWFFITVLGGIGVGAYNIAVRLMGGGPH